MVSKPMMVIPTQVVLQAFYQTDQYGNPVGGSADGYETVAASQTNQILGTTGALGDTLSSLTIIPGSTSPGAVSIKDGSGASIVVFPGGATSVVDLKPFTIQLNLKSQSGPWSVTTGANVSVIANGNFT